VVADNDVAARDAESPRLPPASVPVVIAPSAAKDPALRRIVTWLRAKQ
jgi:hypothetical protein